MESAGERWGCSRKACVASSAHFTGELYTWCACELITLCSCVQVQPAEAEQQTANTLLPLSYWAAAVAAAAVGAAAVGGGGAHVAIRLFPKVVEKPDLGEGWA